MGILCMVDLQCMFEEITEKDVALAIKELGLVYFSQNGCYDHTVSMKHESFYTVYSCQFPVSHD